MKWRLRSVISLLRTSLHKAPLAGTTTVGMGSFDMLGAVDLSWATLDEFSVKYQLVERVESFLMPVPWPLLG